ncbi:MAG TPA: dihydrofolate reductase [Thermoanaerobaculia bacterium]|nr:dihydrofolate reductase [Thermoanaerobaculia bacterium]
MRITLIAAMAANRTIGLHNDLPWRLPPDVRRFKALTLGHFMIMGRRTFDSIGRRPLPGRPTIVVTRDPAWSAPEVEVAHSLDEALAKVKKDEDEVFVAGGAEIFREAMDRADRIQLTRIEKDFPGDTFFPEIPEEDWEIVGREDHGPTEQIPFAYSFLVLERRKDPSR